MNLETQVIISSIIGVLATALSFFENKLSKKEKNSRENLKVGVITFVSVFGVLFFMSSKKSGMTQVIHTGTPGF